ncbi:acetate/propionate family kinase [Nonomuraea sp. NBC_01738]|uniref:acetate/propionate family kinase n=1 Tax=Nonomuraea sp. NBC_01738 TaxID=2976003 RepID=UPI002E0F2FC6|nr:acetate/propionate family kinase [Nonomuraea sp. NBC_01738]
MAVLVLNAGSSTLKYALIDMPAGRCLDKGTLDGPDQLPRHPVPDLIGHRVVHGGTRFRDPVLVDDAVLAAIEDLSELAPLHNPAALTGIKAAAEAFPGVPQAAVFDTAFHTTLPPAAYTYAVPGEWEVRRFGFHGISCAHATRRTCELLGRSPATTNLIVLHLGNGASATAVEGGRSVDTSMGMTPAEGLVMGTRPGDLDPAVPLRAARVHGPAAVEDTLHHRSGLLALTGTSDMREVRLRADADAGDPDARLARLIYAHRIRKYVGAYYALLGHVHAIVFTGGVGEHDPGIRAAALSGLERLGIHLDPIRNTDPDEPLISADDSEVRLLVLPADEETEIARQIWPLYG